MESSLARTERLLGKVKNGNKIFAIFLKKAGKHADKLADRAENLAIETGKTLTRALADVLTEKHV